MRRTHPTLLSVPESESVYICVTFPVKPLPLRVFLLPPFFPPSLPFVLFSLSSSLFPSLLSVLHTLLFSLLPSFVPPSFLPSFLSPLLLLSPFPLSLIYTPVFPLSLSCPSSQAIAACIATLIVDVTGKTRERVRHIQCTRVNKRNWRNWLRRSYCLLSAYFFPGFEPG